MVWHMPHVPVSEQMGSMFLSSLRGNHGNHAPDLIRTISTFQSLTFHLRLQKLLCVFESIVNLVNLF